MQKDDLGLPLSGASSRSRELYAEALGNLQRFGGDPVARLNEALELDPHFTMAHVLKGYLFALSTDAAATRTAAKIHEAAQATSGTERERVHVAALGALTRGGWHDAGALLQELTTTEPRDALALQAGHQIDFFTGNAARLRDRIGSAIPHWHEGMPGYHAVLAAHAFGLEENGDYAAAEKAGRRAVELEPRNGWAQHAVAHVMEMQCRQRDGIAWMRANPDVWSQESFLQVHNWWHLALFHFDLGEADEVLALYDGPIWGNQSKAVLNMVDASAILWRLHLGGIDAGQRWNTLADAWEPAAGAANYAFNDMHAMMAFVGAGRPAAAGRLLEAQQSTMRGTSDNAGFTRDVGHPAAKAIWLFGQGQYREVVALLKPLSKIAHRFGGSHAQRDVIDLTLIEAALRARDGETAAMLAGARKQSRPESPLSHLFADRAAVLLP